MRSVAATCLGFAACFAPAPEAGAPCGEGGTCPRELACAPATNTCEVPNAAPDAMLDAPVEFCFGAHEVTSCVAMAPGEPFDIPGNIALTLDTDDSAMCDLVLGSDPGSCVKLASAITITGVLRAQGTRPLVLVASSTVAIDGLVDVASRSAQAELGAGANPSSCVAGTAAELHAGGSGGSFGGKGGNGNLGVEPATGGVAAEVTTAITALRGGCPGGNGAAVLEGNPPGAGANGGGAVFVIAGTSLTIAGAINASGAGGGGCDDNCGGGGGGSGGMIGLEAPQITVAAGGEVFANGGGGGEGSQANPTNPGGESSAAGTPAPGGTGGSCASDGGPGAQGANLAGADGVVATCTNSGGGGGGGGAGVIRIHGTLTTEGVISPQLPD